MEEPLRLFHSDPPRDSSRCKVLGTFTFREVRSDPEEFRRELGALLAKLPSVVTQALVEAAKRHGYSPELTGLCELYLQLGRRPEAIFADKTGRTRRCFIVDSAITPNDINLFAELFRAEEGDRTRIGTGHKRKGLRGTLHRLSVITHPGKGPVAPILGVTARVGRVVRGTVHKMAPTLLDRARPEGSGPLLLIGRPGVGKTTVLRELARLLSEDMSLNVVVVDKTCEIAGDDVVPHSAIGSARWMPVAKQGLQHAIMLEAVENQSPDVMIVDEISTPAEVDAARTISQRGVRLIATVHGTTLAELIRCRERGALCGGQQTVTLADATAARRADKRKTVQKREREPVFTSAVELHEREHWLLHPCVKTAVDAYFEGEPSACVELLPGRSIAVAAIAEDDGFSYCRACGARHARSAGGASSDRSCALHRAGAARGSPGSGGGGAGGGRRQVSGACFNCGASGHYSRDCPRRGEATRRR
jgi:stage III sporulation protein SpoIIIAA